MCVGISSSDCLMQKIFFETHFEQNQIRYDNPFLIFGLFLYITTLILTGVKGIINYISPLGQAIFRLLGANIINVALNASQYWYIISFFQGNQIKR